MPRRNKSLHRHGRSIPKRKTKKELKAMFLDAWSNFFYHIQDTEKKTIEINGVEDYFNPVSFEVNKIHILRGDNGQGKTTLIKNIANSTSAGALYNMPRIPLKIMTNNVELGRTLNIAHQPYSEGLMGSNPFDTGLSNMDKNITIYTDFSTEFFDKDSDLIDGFDLIKKMDKHSNGEQKIAGINDILAIVNVLQHLEEDKIQEHLNIIILMDEPESGLSISIQKEFKRKLQFYINKMNDKISLTFIIASHSFIWERTKLIKLYDVGDFKKENSKKEHKRVFV